MKKKTVPLILISAILSVVSCLKQDMTSDPNAELKSGSLLSLAQTWYQQQSTENGKALLEPIWSNSYVEDFSNGEKLLVVATKDFQLANKDVQFYRVFAFREKNGKINDGKIVEFFGNPDYINTKKKELVKGYNTSVIKGFSGGMISYDVNYHLLQGSVFKNGNKTKASCSIKQPTRSVTSTNRTNVPTTTLANREGGCIAWFWVEYDASTGAETWTYLYTTCSEDHGGSGGSSPPGGGIPQEQQACVDAAIQASVALANSMIGASETVEDNVRDIDGFKKARTLTWRCLKNLTYALLSHESGIVELVNVQQNTWQWVSLTHNTITLAGAPVGGEVSITSQIGTPSFIEGTPNVQYAGMFLNFTVKYAPICNCPGVNAALPPTYIPYVASALWSAQP